MPNPLHHGLHERLRSVADKFDALCRDHNLQYTIESDTHNEQGYLIRGHDVDNTSVKIHMDEYIQNKWVNMAVEDNKRGAYFKFTVQSLFEYPENWNVKTVEANEIKAANLENVNSDEWVSALVNNEFVPPVVLDNDTVVNPDVLKAFLEHGMQNIPTMSEEQRKQTGGFKRASAPFSGSAIGTSKTMGGQPVGGTKKKKTKRKRKKVAEDINSVYELSKPLLAHDNVTIIPRGSTITIVDDDPELPDVKLEDGRILNVDRAELDACIKENVSDRLDRLISENMAISLMPGLDILGVAGGHDHDHDLGHHSLESGNMEASFEPPTDAISQRVTGALDSLGSMMGLGGPACSPVLDSLNKLRASEIVSALQYELFATTVGSMNMGALQEVFWEHYDDELKHAKKLAQRIHELGGDPIADLEQVSQQSAIQIEQSKDATGMISILKEQEKIAVDAYRAAIRQCSDDPSTRNLLEEILRSEEEHLSDMDSMIG